MLRIGNVAPVSTSLPARRLPAAERRELILRAAARCFGSRGYEGAQLERIAADAGVTKPILYRHFESKEGIYLALLDRHREELPAFVSDLDPTAPLADLIETILRGWFGYAAENGARWRMLFRDSGGTAAIRSSRERMYADAREVLAGFLRAHPDFEVAPGAVEATAEMIRGGLSALVLYGQEHSVARSELVAAGTRMIVGLARDRT